MKYKKALIDIMNHTLFISGPDMVKFNTTYNIAKEALYGETTCTKT